MRIAYLTAGAAGMYCGSCMHDNDLARALIGRGCDCLLLPVYTPIRTDQTDVSSERVFFGGINVFLQQKAPVLGRLPAPMLRLLDAPWLLRWATRRAGGTRAETLGDLTVSMLQGAHGHQASEVRRLVRWLADDFRPDAIILSNLLIGGCIPAIRQSMDTRVVVWMQGDDIFLDHLPTPQRVRATELMTQLAQQVDGFLVNSRFYADKMGRLLRIPEDKWHVLPLAIPTEPFAEPQPPLATVAAVSSDRPMPLQSPAQSGPPEPSGPPPEPSGSLAAHRSLPRRSIPDGADGRAADQPVRIGYFARLAPEKGFHLLADAFIELSHRLGAGRVELHYGGWLGEQNRRYFDAARRKLDDASLAAYHRHHGSPDLQGKLAFLRGIDLLCVPTVYEEPKGLFVLEALAAGVPVVQPDHGAFPELLASTGGGRLFQSGSGESLVAALAALVESAELRRELATIGRSRVNTNHSIANQAAGVHRLLSDLVQPPPASDSVQRNSARSNARAFPE